MAADRSDDIKQLFSHLGLNPGDYQEIRERSRAATRGESLMPGTRSSVATPAVPPTVAPAAGPLPSAPLAPTVPLVPEPAMPPPAAAAPVRTAPAVAPPAPAPGDPTARWPLLRAAVETPTRVAQIDRSQADAAPADPPLPIITDDAPTRRLFQELSRRPVDEAVDQLAEAARRRWQPLPEAPAYEPPPAAAPASASVPPASAPAPAAPEFSASGELLSTFQRLVAPERVAQQKPARLHFNYQADASAPRVTQPREENLGDVFSRIADPRFPR